MLHRFMYLTVHLQHIYTMEITRTWNCQYFKSYKYSHKEQRHKGFWCLHTLTIYTYKTIFTRQNNTYYCSNKKH